VEIENSVITIEIKGEDKSKKRMFQIEWDQEQKKYSKKFLVEKILPRVQERLPIISNKIKKDQLTKAFSKPK